MVHGNYNPERCYFKVKLGKAAKSEALHHIFWMGKISYLPQGPGLSLTAKGMSQSGPQLCHGKSFIWSASIRCYMFFNNSVFSNCPLLLTNFLLEWPTTAAFSILFFQSMNLWCFSCCFLIWLIGLSSTFILSCLTLAFGISIKSLKVG